MITIDSIKNKLFSNQTSQDLLVAAIEGAKDFNQAFDLLFFQTKEKDFQKILSLFLRSLAIHHLRSLESDYARKFKAEYEHLYSQGLMTISYREYRTKQLETTGRFVEEAEYEQLVDKGLVESRSHSAYLDWQSKDTIWADDIAAGALGAVLHMKVMVTGITIGGVVQTSMKIGDVMDMEAPIIHLYNMGNRHYHIYEKYPADTVDDGNCLYNAIAQVLRHMVLSAKAAENAPIGTIVADNTLNELKTYQTQADLLARIQGVAVVPIHELMMQIKASIKLSDESDHQFAFVLAQDEFKSNSRLAAFEFQLGLINLKATELCETAKTDITYLEAAKVAKKLVDKLFTYYQNYLLDYDYIAFKNNANGMINEARPVLEIHRGWKQLLGNFILAILGLGVFYAAAAMCNKYVTGQYLFFKTDSAIRLDALEASLSDGIVSTL